MRAIDRLTANIKSRTKEGIGMIKNITAKSAERKITNGKYQRKRVH